MNSTTAQRAKYALGDFIALNLGWFLFTIIRYRSLPPEFCEHYSFISHLTSLPVSLGQAIIPLAMMALYWLSGYYNQAWFKSRLDEVVNTAAVSLVGTLGIYFTVLLDDAIPERMMAMEMMALLWVLLFLPVLVIRLAITTRSIKAVREGKIVFPTLIFGNLEQVRALASRFEKFKGKTGFRIVGTINPENHDITAPIMHSRLTEYPLSSLKQLIEEKNVQRVIVMPHPSGVGNTIGLINSLLTYNLRLFVTPDMYSLIVARPRIEDVAGEPLVDITSPTVSAAMLNFKRLSDILVSALALALLFPVYAIVALAVKTDSKGPVFYAQERVGRMKKTFRIYKFRTMNTNAEAEGPALSTADDPRITKVGRFLRKYRLDEIPQFYNVLRGDMSLVGPRPERDFYIRRITERAPYYSLLLRIRPGITSWGMVKYGYAENVDQMVERLRYDLLYLENISLSVDLRILFHTVSTVLRGRGQ